MSDQNPDTENFDPVGKHTLEVISGATRFNKWMYAEIKPFLKGDILEIGSGIGNISQYVINNGYDITLSDYNPAYYKYLQENFSKTPNVRSILQLDLLHPDFKTEYAALEEKFDTIFMLNVIEHLKDDPIAVDNCKFMLKQNGHFIVLAPAYNWLYCRIDKELGHYRRYTLKKMKQLIKDQNMEVINGQYFNFLGTIGWFLFGKVFKRKMLGKEMNSFNQLVPIAKLLDKLFMKRIGLSVIVTGKKKI